MEKLEWLFGLKPVELEQINGLFVGPRATMITPWSTNAVEITQNMGIMGIERIEVFLKHEKQMPFDAMLLQQYEKLHQTLFEVNIAPEPILNIENIAAFNQTEGLALNQ